MGADSVSLHRKVRLDVITRFNNLIPRFFQPYIAKFERLDSSAGNDKETLACTLRTKNQGQKSDSPSTI